jgi:hypothetical protein
LGEINRDVLEEEFWIGKWRWSHDLISGLTTLAMQGLQFIFQRDREIPNSAPDLSRVYGGEP